MDGVNYLPKQMNGPVVTSYAESVGKEFSEAETICDYLYNLSLDTAQETELENIGRLIGYTRPLVPLGFEQESIFLLGDLPQTQEAQNGFSTIDSEIGGRLSGLVVETSSKMDLGSYRQILKKVAYLKRYGITLAAIDKIASATNANYTLSYTANHDIEVHFAENIGYRNVYVLTQLFYRIATEPQVIIVSGQ